ncbi:MAG TPA: YaaR family protein [Pseudogracilibacillus sp.]|nr:YaaR family protein [Pseudogracilibacillus sp.]
MKISQDYNSKIDQKPIRKTKEDNQTFRQIVSSKAGTMQQAELVRLIDDITEQGEKIARFRSFKDLARFKRMIRQFLQKTVGDGLTLEKSRSFNADNYSETLSTVKQVDEKLIQLTDDLLDQEKKTVDILGLIGEIRGLLINLTT